MIDLCLRIEAKVYLGVVFNRNIFVSIERCSSSARHQRLLCGLDRILLLVSIDCMVVDSFYTILLALSFDRIVPILDLIAGALREVLCDHRPVGSQLDDQLKQMACFLFSPRLTFARLELVVPSVVALLSTAISAKLVSDLVPG